MAGWGSACFHCDTEHEQPINNTEALMALSAKSCWPEHARSPENTTATFAWMKNKTRTAGGT